MCSVINLTSEVHDSAQGFLPGNFIHTYVPKLPNIVPASASLVQLSTTSTATCALSVVEPAPPYYGCYSGYKPAVVLSHFQLPPCSSDPEQSSQDETSTRTSAGSCRSGTHSCIAFHISRCCQSSTTHSEFTHTS